MRAVFKLNCLMFCFSLTLAGKFTFNLIQYRYPIAKMLLQSKRIKLQLGIDQLSWSKYKRNKRMLINRFQTLDINGLLSIFKVYRI